MIWRYLLLTPLLSGTGNAQALCHRGKGDRIILTVPDQSLTFAAEAPADRYLPGPGYDISRPGYPVFLIDCLLSAIVSRSVTGPEPCNLQNKTCETNIICLVIKPLRPHGLTAWRGFPSAAVIPEMDGSGYVCFRFTEVSGDRGGCCKEADSLRLRKPAGNLVLPPGPIGDFYLIVSKDPNNNLSKRLLNEINVSSPPVYPPDRAKTVNSGKIAARMPGVAVQERLHFAINGKTSYGSDSAMADITTDIPSYDVATLRVTNARDSSGCLRLPLRESLDRLLKVNVKEGEQITSPVSPDNTEFHGIAELSAAGLFQPSAEHFLPKLKSFLISPDR